MYVRKHADRGAAADMGMWKWIWTGGGCGGCSEDWILGGITVILCIWAVMGTRWCVKYVGYKQFLSDGPWASTM